MTFHQTKEEADFARAQIARMSRRPTTWVKSIRQTLNNSKARRGDKHSPVSLATISFKGCDK